MDREKLIFLLSKKKEHNLLGFQTGGYLFDVGWVRSMADDSVVDKDGKPLPWVTYPFISFIEGRLTKGLEIFEFGSGNSTLFYATKVASVQSVENDKFWYDKIKNTMPRNSELFFCNVMPGEDYCKFASKMGGEYDVIIVDGRDRVNCCINSISSLKPAGIVVLDDSDREEYASGVDFLLEKGFKRIDFWGMAPMVENLKCTTIFYRDNNCLSI